MNPNENNAAKGDWFVEAVRQITTPIALIAFSLFCLAWIGSSIASASLLGEIFKGVLLLLALLIFASIMGASFFMAIYHPRHFTFDKEAHQKVALDIPVGDAAGTLAFGKLLAINAGNPAAIERIAELMRQVDDSDAEGQPRIADAGTAEAEAG